MLVIILRFLHVFSNYIWMGAFLLIGAYLANRKQELTLNEANTIHRLYYKFELPGLIGAITFGVLLIFLSPSVNMKAGWFHLKLTSVFLLLLLDLFWFRRQLSPCQLFGQNGRGIFIPRVLGGLFFVATLVSIYILKPLMETT
jgi:uncharacterized membrane protein